jgi:hypothetical protein
MGNRERIARAAEEARITQAEKSAKKATKPATGARAKKAAIPVRIKIVWDVCGATGAKVESFPYPEKAAALAAAEALTNSTGRTHAVRESRVPME